MIDHGVTFEESKSRDRFLLVDSDRQHWDSFGSVPKDSLNETLGRKSFVLDDTACGCSCREQRLPTLALYGTLGTLGAAQLGDYSFV